MLITIDGRAVHRYYPKKSGGKPVLDAKGQQVYVVVYSEHFLGCESLTDIDGRPMPPTPGAGRPQEELAEAELKVLLGKD